MVLHGNYGIYHITIYTSVLLNLCGMIRSKSHNLTLLYRPLR